MGVFKEEMAVITEAQKRQGYKGVEATPELKEAIKELMTLQSSKCILNSNENGEMRRLYALGVKIEEDYVWTCDVLFAKKNLKETFTITPWVCKTDEDHCDRVVLGPKTLILEKDKSYEVEYGLR